jgi:hypothetical protein
MTIGEKLFGVITSSRWLIHCSAKKFCSNFTTSIQFNFIQTHTHTYQDKVFSLHKEVAAKDEEQVFSLHFVLFQRTKLLLFLLSISNVHRSVQISTNTKSNDNLNYEHSCLSKNNSTWTFFVVWPRSKPCSNWIALRMRLPFYIQAVVVVKVSWNQGSHIFSKDLHLSFLFPNIPSPGLKKNRIHVTLHLDKKNTHRYQNNQEEKTLNIYHYQ